jgi:putative transposase
MPRIARVVASGLPHHVTQRGNYKQIVFNDATDREQYLAWIKKYSEEYGLSILAYCLMNNHVHFITIPDKLDSLAKTFNAAHMRYSQYFNRKSGQHGHLWQGRFYSCVLDEPHLILAARYIERNPVRAGLVKTPWQWQWSSAIAHINGQKNGPIKLGDLLGIIGVQKDYWQKYISSVESSGFLQEIRKYTLNGRPLGKPTFVDKLEAELKRNLSALPIGRPKME